MKDKERLLYVILLIVAAIVCIWIATEIKTRADLIRKQESYVKKATFYEQNKDKIKLNMASWVMDNSTVITTEEAKEIVDAVMNYKDPIMLLAIMQVESSFNPKATSIKGAIGLGQIMPFHKDTLVEAGFIETLRDLYKIENNIKAMIYLIRRMLEDNDGDIDGMLTSYLGANNGTYKAKIYSNYADICSFSQVAYLLAK